MSNIELLIVILFFAANLMLAVIAWSIGQVNMTLRKRSIQALSQHMEIRDLLRANVSEIQRANGRIR